ncbi:MAG: hypothetical protein JJW00_05110 [Sulfurimonas sp.]|nr:hypothetical protein [Sulfurimonas sp.]
MNDFIDMMEQTPKLNSKKCKLFSTLLQYFLQYSIYVVGIITWLIYDYFIGIATFLLSFIIVGIIRSKITNSAIPIKQREHRYTDKEIAEWFIAKEIC